MNVLEVSHPRRGPLPSADRVDIWTADLDRVAGSLPAPIDLVDEPERQQAGRFRFEADRRRFVARRAVLRVVLGRHLGLHPRDVRIDRGRGAKPEIRGTDALYFNATASGTTALVAISGAEVGIDIERVDDRSDIKSLAGRWLSTEERSHVDRLPRRERPRALFACLTKKEAVLKAAGVGLGLDPSVVSIPSGGDGPVEVPTLPPSSWWVRPLTLGRSLVGGLATTRPAPTVTRFVLRDLSGTRTALS